MARATIRCLTDLYLAVSDNKLHCPKTIYFEQSLFLIKRFHNVGKELTSHPGFTISEIRKRQSFDNFEAAWFCQLTNNYSLLFTAVHVCELKHSESVYGNFAHLTVHRWQIAKIQQACLCRKVPFHHSSKHLWDPIHEKVAAKHLSPIR